MANIVVSINNAYTIKVEFNDYFPNYYDKKISYYNRSEIEKIDVYSDRIKVRILGGIKDWELSYNEVGGSFIVDEVNGVTTITSNEHLAELIANLISY